MKKVISSSEVAAYNFCARAWYFAARKVPVSKSKRSALEANLASGSSLHEEHFHRAKMLNLKEKFARVILAAIAFASAIVLLIP